jgi:DNA recombination protein RmuC
MDKLGRSLTQSVQAYNKAIGTMETRVLVTARKFKELKAADAGVELESLEPLDQVTRQLQAPELEQTPTGTAALPTA